jgi:hypothetical protein
MKIYNALIPADNAAVSNKALDVEELSYMIERADSVMPLTPEQIVIATKVKRALLAGRDALVRDLAAVAYWKN